MEPKPGVIDQSRVFEGKLFATPLDRCRYIGTSSWKRPQWLKDHPDVWRFVQDVEQEAASLGHHVKSEGPVEAVAAEPSPHMSSPDVRNDGRDADNAGSVEIPAGEPSPPQQPQLAMTLPVTDAAASAPDDEVALGPRRYVSAELAASLLGISRRTLSRRCAAGKAPPKIKLGNKAYFEIAKVPG
jgi:hypothetical protein